MQLYASSLDSVSESPDLSSYSLCELNEFAEGLSELDFTLYRVIQEYVSRIHATERGQ